MIVVIKFGTENEPLILLRENPPMEVTVLGIVVFLQPKNSSFFFVTIIALQLSRES